MCAPHLHTINLSVTISRPAAPLISPLRPAPTGIQRPSSAAPSVTQVGGGFIGGEIGKGAVGGSFGYDALHVQTARGVGVKEFKEADR